MPVFFCFGCGQLDRHDGVLTLIGFRTDDELTLMSARHFSSPSMRQRLAARGSSPGGCREPGMQRRCKTKDFWRLDISPNIPKSPQSRKREQVQCLGDMPWLSRATAMRPDASYVADASAKFKKAAANN
jgi:hypothetical protein